MAAIGAGLEISPAMFHPEDWTEYTPTWSSTGTQPDANVAGGGSVLGQYVQVQKTVFFQGRIVLGSAPTVGTGFYKVTLPVNASNNFGSNGIIGSAWLRDSSGNIDPIGFLIEADPTYFQIRGAGSTYPGSSAWSATYPFVPAAGDWFAWCGTYRAA